MSISINRLSIYILALFLSGCPGSDSDSDSSSEVDETATYRITVSTNWTAQNFPTNYPASAHFSPVVGVAHNSNVEYWSVLGEPATKGVKEIAETGNTSIFLSEVNEAVDSGFSREAFKASGIGSGAGQEEFELEFTQEFNLLTLLTMIAPSPDWFIGVASYSMLDESGDWIESETIQLAVYDAGTDGGIGFSSPNEDISSQNLSIQLLTSSVVDTDFIEGLNSNGDALGELIIERID